MTNVKPATDEQVADILGDLHQYHDYKMAECPFCAPIRARIDADREENAANAHLIAQGIKVVNEQAAEIAALKAEVATERELRAGVEVSLRNLRGFSESPITPRYDAPMSGDAVVVRDVLAAAFGREIALTQANDALKAEVERLSVRECGPCLGVGRIASSWEGREVNIDCPNCGGTGRAR